MYLGDALDALVQAERADEHADDAHGDGPAHDLAGIGEHGIEHGADVCATFSPSKVPVDILMK